MQLTLSALQEYFADPLDVDLVTATLISSGIEVDAVEHRELLCPQAICAQIEQVSPHPQADRLAVAQVFDGQQHLTIVCGAPNCRAGLKVALAPIGSSLLTGDSQPVKIKKSKLRGVYSYGMLLSEKELGLSQRHHEILELPAKSLIGTPLSGLVDDPIFTLGLTPNLGHCMSTLGVARELGAFLERPLVHPPPFPLAKRPPPDLTLQVEVEQDHLCSQYGYCLIKQIKVGPSPLWLVQRLEAGGVRSINNVVDALNYIMLTQGQPLHAFDFDQLGSERLTIRRARSGESMTTLDELERALGSQVMIIADEHDIPQVIAGVMGGVATQVRSTTTSLLIEAAQFSPQAVRLSSKQLQLRSQSSSRFERGVDGEGVLTALHRAGALVEQLTQGEAYLPHLHTFVSEHAKHIPCRLSQVNHILGLNLKCAELRSFLTRLSIKTSLRPDRPGVLLAVPPSYRHDLTEEIDLIEEVARLYGYGRIENTLPDPVPLSQSIAPNPRTLFEERLRTHLVAEGLQEFLSCTLISHTESQLETPLAQQMEREGSITTTYRPLDVLHPSSQDQAILRRTFLPNMLRALKLNHDHHQLPLQAFEIGLVYDQTAQGQPRERWSLALLLCGARSPAHFSRSKQAQCGYDFFDLKGLISSLFERFEWDDPIYRSSHLPLFHPHRQAQLCDHRADPDQESLGYLAQLHTDLLNSFQIKSTPSPVLFAQLSLSPLFNRFNKSLTHIEPAKPLPLYPSSTRDVTFQVDTTQAAQQIVDTLQEDRDPRLIKIELTDLYTGHPIPADKQALTFRLHYRSSIKTLSQAEIDHTHQRLVDHVTQRFHL